MKNFESVSINENSNKWKNSIKRESNLYKKENDIRDPFARDFTRILHSYAFRRLKHKTQVFFATTNDHICTRIEHVNHVSSVSETICNELGLNCTLARTISYGHDLGHAPFGHQGETILAELTKKHLNYSFWHEKNSLYFVDDIEILPAPDGYSKNLDLTYAVRDGIVCHCGEVDQNGLVPREDYIDLRKIEKGNQPQPYTWEGCVVKVSDKISYIGRDIEDALALKILSPYELFHEYRKIIKEIFDKDISFKELNNTSIIHNLIINLIEYSSPENGISFSDQYNEFIKEIKKFNYENIYKVKRLEYFKNYARLIIESIFDFLLDSFDSVNTLNKLGKYRISCPKLVQYYNDWLQRYSNIDTDFREKNKLRTPILYNIKEQDDYTRAIIDFISGMTDPYAIDYFNEIISFGI